MVTLRPCRVRIPRCGTRGRVMKLTQHRNCRSGVASMLQLAAAIYGNHTFIAVIHLAPDEVIASRARLRPAPAATAAFHSSTDEHRRGRASTPDTGRDAGRTCHPGARPRHSGERARDATRAIRVRPAAHAPCFGADSACRTQSTITVESHFSIFEATTAAHTEVVISYGLTGSCLTT